MILSRHGIHRSPHQRVRKPIWFRIHRVVDVTRACLLGDQQPGGIVTVTTDLSPELVFRFPSTPLTSVTLSDGANTFGPFPIVGNIASLPSNLPAGIYSVVDQAVDSNGDLGRVCGTIRVITTASTLLIGDTMSLLIGDTADLLIETA